MPTASQSDPHVSHDLLRRDFLKLAAYLGVALVAPRVRAVPAPGLSPRELAVVSEVAELIIPATDTGGAIAAGVPAFVEKMVTEWFIPEEKAHFLEALRAFDEAAQTRYGRPFADLGGAEKAAWFGEQLAAAERGMTPSAIPFLGGAASSALPRSPFAVLMKRLTVVGYYTSELGATRELTMTVVFHDPPGCAPVEPGDRADSVALYTIPFRAY
jgi:gluconate 2-dehydrogenase gamma chain